MSYLKNLLLKLPFMTEKLYSIFMYIVMGGLTTVINFVVFWLTTKGLGIDYKLANFIAWFFSVVFAYVTNRAYVFEAKTTGLRAILKEMTSFFSFRIVSFIIELVVLIGLVSGLKVDEVIAKILASVIVLILNYIFSKVFVFKDQK